MSVEFTALSEKFRGTVSAAGLTLKNAAGESQTLTRKPCGSYFK